MSLVPLLRGNAEGWPERTLFVHVQRQEIPPKWIRSTAMTDRWRLIDGAELYDIQADPGQQKDIAAQHADVVAGLRQSYEQWWASLAPALTRYGHIVIGSEKESPARLTCHDWHSDQVPWDQGAVRNAPWANGYWMIEVAEQGRYEFTLRQQPAEAAFPIEATLARLKVGDAEVRAEIPARATGVTLALELQLGPAKLETWLTDEKAGKSRGAFFVTVRRLD
jgi:hypothetical protein